MIGMRGRGPGRGFAEPPPVEMAEVAGWFAGRLPDTWFTAPPEIIIDREEITVVGTLAAPEVAGDDPASDPASDPARSPAAKSPAAKSPAAKAAAETGRIRRFREETRDRRIAIAREAEHRYARKVAWGARVGDTHELFTTLSAPVMTRLRQPERQVLDTLVDAGVARSRSDALAWCVRLVGQNAEDWLARLRDAMQAVERVRADGPTA